MSYSFWVGRIACTVISDGQPAPPREPPLSTFFTPDSGVPQSELARAVAAEGRHRTTLTCGYNCLCIQTAASLALIDTGLGANFLGYGPEIGQQVGNLGDGLADAGFTVSEVDAVLFTHLHQDHARGAIWSGELTFPRATAFANGAEVAFWPASAAWAAVGPEAEPAREAIRLFGGRLQVMEYDVEILPQVRTVAASGHTPGHTAFLLGEGRERLLCVGDTFYDGLQVGHPGWCTPFDLDPERSVVSRRDLLDWAADENLLVHAYHVPFPGLGRVAWQGDGYRWTPVGPPPHPPGRRLLPA